MRKIVYSVVCLSVILLAACQSKDVPELTTQEKLMGKWKLQKEIDEYYQPQPVLLETEEIAGLDGDSIVFKNDGNVYAYSPIYGNDVTNYQVLNDTTVEIEDELYRIRKLTATELYLYNEYIEPTADEKYIQKLYFVR